MSTKTNQPLSFSALSKSNPSTKGKTSDSLKHPSTEPIYSTKSYTETSISKLHLFSISHSTFMKSSTFKAPIENSQLLLILVTLKIPSTLNNSPLPCISYKIKPESYLTHKNLSKTILMLPSTTGLSMDQQVVVKLQLLNIYQHNLDSNLSNMNLTCQLSNKNSSLLKMDKIFH